jgi:mannose-6-phosphate isomerase-like protein (cupin superfamily)
MDSGAGFETRRVGAAPNAIAPDGSEVRVLCGLGRGGLALFTLPPGAVARPVAHRTIEELWYVVSGKGRIWRRLGSREEVADLVSGVSVSLPTGTHFQFRCDGADPLAVLGATMPPWPGAEEAYGVDGIWPATV